MAATAPLKKSPYMKEWMAQGDPPKEANTMKKMNGRSLLLSSNKTALYFITKAFPKNCSTPKGKLRL